MHKTLHPNRWLIWTIAILIVITIGLLGSIEQAKIELENLSYENVTRKILKKDSSTLLTANWKTYRNEELGIIFDYPPDWIVAEYGGIVTVASPEVVAQGGIHNPENVGIGFTENPDNLSLTEFVTAKHPIYLDSNVYADGLDFTLYGYPTLKFNRLEKGLPFCPLSTLFIKRSTDVIVVSANCSSDFPNGIEEAKWIFESIRIMPTDWKTFKSEKLGFEFMYPAELELNDKSFEIEIISLSRKSKYPKGGIFCNHGIGCYIPDLAQFSIIIEKDIPLDYYVERRTSSFYGSMDVSYEIINGNNVVLLSGNILGYSLSEEAYIELDSSTLVGIRGYYAADLKRPGPNEFETEADESKSYVKRTLRKILSTFKFIDTITTLCQSDADCKCILEPGVDDSCGKPGQVWKCINNQCDLVFEEQTPFEVSAINKCDGFYADAPPAGVADAETRIYSNDGNFIISCGGYRAFTSDEAKEKHFEECAKYEITSECIIVEELP